MTSLAAQISPRWSWPQIEAAMLKIPLERFTAAQRFGACEDDGLKVARAKMADDVRRELELRADATPA